MFYICSHVREIIANHHAAECGHGLAEVADAVAALLRKSCFAEAVDID
jgi:hypothetical protein